MPEPATQPLTPRYSSRAPSILLDVEAHLENGEREAAFHRMLDAFPALTSDAEIAAMVERVRIAAKDSW